MYIPTYCTYIQVDKPSAKPGETFASSHLAMSDTIRTVAKKVQDVVSTGYSYMKSHYPSNDSNPNGCRGTSYNYVLVDRYYS